MHCTNGEKQFLKCKFPSWQSFLCWCQLVKIQIPHLSAEKINSLGTVFFIPVHNILSMYGGNLVPKYLPKTELVNLWSKWILHLVNDQEDFAFWNFRSLAKTKISQKVKIYDRNSHFRTKLPILADNLGFWLNFVWFKAKSISWHMHFWSKMARLGKRGGQVSLEEKREFSSLEVLL